MSDVSDMLRQIHLGGKAFKAGGLEDLLSFLESGESKADGCGPNCPIHGEGGLLDTLKGGEERTSTVADVHPDTITPEEALSLAVGAAVGAQYKIEVGKYEHAKVMQEQAFLWTRIAEQLTEIRPWQDRIADVIKTADSKLQDAYADREELREEAKRQRTLAEQAKKSASEHANQVDGLYHELVGAKAELNRVEKELSEAKQALEESRPVSE